MRALLCTLAVAVAGTAVAVAGCHAGPAADTGATTDERPATPAGPTAVAPEVVFRTSGDISLGAPLGVSVDFGGTAFIADTSPGRLVAWDPQHEHVVEFHQPDTPGFYPTDIGVRGFFVYAIDETGRTLLRFDNSGTFRDVLINFEAFNDRRRVSPYGLAVEGTGRIAVTDVENHQVLLINNYLQLELAFGNYGSYAGQLDTPRGVSFMSGGRLLVTDTGNRRLQVFSDGGAFLLQIPPPDVDSPLQRPRRAVAAPDGRVFVADPLAGRVFVFSAAGVPVASLVPAGAKRFEPTDVALTTDGRLLVTDTATQSLYVFKGM